MSSVAVSLAAALQLYLTATLADGVEVSSSITPLTDLFIAYGSSAHVVFCCEISGDDSYTVLWELSGRQVPSNVTDGIIIQHSADGRMSTLTVTDDGRSFIGQELISVECHANNVNVFGLVEGKQLFHIVQFGPPGEVDDLQLTYFSERELKLQWRRPVDINPNVPITYLAHVINSTASITQRYETTETYVLVNQTGEDMCQPHLFSVVAMNDAGESSASIITESIPLSLSIAPVTSSQKVDQLLLAAAGANITVSFEPATNCSARFPVLNYTVTVAGLEGGVVVDDPSPSASLISLTLSPAHIPQLSVDKNYSIIITACTDFTCRSPPQPLVAVTTGTQAASVLFYTTAVSLNCSFAAGSSASGCLFVFHLTNENRSEDITVYYTADDVVMFNTSCDQLSNTRGAYDDQVLVYDIESDGTTGSQAIIATVAVADETDNFTCPLPFCAIAGIVVASVLALLFLVFFIVALIVFILAWRKRRVDPGSSWFGDLKVVLALGDHTRPDGRVRSDGTDDTDGQELLPNTSPVMKFPVMRLTRGRGDRSVTVQLLQCDDTKNWVTGLEEGCDILLYPQTHPQGTT